MNVINIAVTKRRINPERKTKSAISSKRKFIRFFERIEIKDRILLAMKKIKANEAASSMIVDSFKLRTWIEVITIKQSPSRLDEAFKICGDL